MKASPVLSHVGNSSVLAFALARLYFNMMLVREWHGGDIPQKGREEEMYVERARRKADKGPGPSPTW